MELFDKFIILYGNTQDVIPAVIIINMNNSWISKPMVSSVCSRGVPGRLKLSAICIKLLILSLKGVQLFKQIIN